MVEWNEEGVKFDLDLDDEDEEIVFNFVKLLLNKYFV